MARLTRQERAKVRGFVRWSARKNHRSRSDLRDAERRNAKVQRDGMDAAIIHLQDKGAGLVMALQILSELRLNGRPWLKRAQKTAGVA